MNTNETTRPARTFDASRAREGAVKLGRIHRDLLYLIDSWDDLHDARVPGTKRRWRQGLSRAESRRRASADYARTVLGMPAAPAPANVDVLDVIVDVVASAHALSDAVAQLAGVDRLPAPSSAYADPRPHLRHIRDHLAAAAEVDGGWVIDAALDTHPDQEMSIARPRRRVTSALRELDPGHLLDCDCPWCGSRPMRVRMVGDEPYSEPLVVCEARTVCEPPEGDVGVWLRGRPAWHREDWDWLVGRIRHADEEAS